MRAPSGMTDEERANWYLEHTTRQQGDCLIWTGTKDHGGRGRYGVVGHCGTSWTAHRFVYKALVGPVDGREVHHCCRNPLCINPAHLTAKTPDEHKAEHARLRRAA